MGMHSSLRSTSLSTFSPRLAVFVGAMILLMAGFRVLRAIWLPELPNFSPIAAVAFCGGLFLPGLVAWVLPLGALLVSDVFLSLALGFSPFSVSQLVVWGSIAGVVGIGRWVSAWSDVSALKFFSALMVGGVGFYVVTNTGAWLMNPAYPRGLDGLWMSLTTGLPGFPPSWVFFRNSLVSDLMFGSLLLAVRAYAQQQDLRHAEVA